MILTLIGLVGALAAPAAPAQPTPDSVLLDMQQAFSKGDSKRLTALLPQVKGHPLQAWAAYWELSARLGTAKPDEIMAFFQKYAGTYQEDRLRNDWLLLLGKQRNWTQFAVVAPDFRMNDDREVRCYTLAMENILAKVDLADEVKTQWYSQKDAGDACTLAAQSHFAAKQLDASEVWRKARLTLETHQFQSTPNVVAIVAPDASAASAALNDILKNPELFLLKQTPSSQRQTQELTVLALIRWAQSRPDSAAQALQSRWAKYLSAEQLAWAWGAIGMQAAQALSSDALGYFANAKPGAMSDEQLAWRARTALRQHQWSDALDAIVAMSPQAGGESTWVYWRARALLQPGRSQAEREQGQQLLQSIASVRGFYPLLAQEELGLPIIPPAIPAALTAAEKSQAKSNPGLQRALAAMALGLRSEGVREWNYSTNLHRPGGMDDRELLAAADLACENAVWDRCINTSERTRSFIDLSQRFPMPHRQAVIERSLAIGLDPAYVYGLIRQESRFITDARSGVGASGLMQVMPATARWTARKIGLTDFKTQQLGDRDTNIAIGTGYLKLVLDDFAGSMPLAAAAYNAGPNRPRSWRGSSGAAPIEAAIWAENIPFRETRDYVKKVLANTTLYAAMISGKTQSLKARLGLIGPREGIAPVNNDLP